MRKIKELNDTTKGIKLKVMYNHTLSEYQVKVWLVNGMEWKHEPALDYFTDNKDDAIATMQEIAYRYAH